MWGGGGGWGGGRYVYYARIGTPLPPFSLSFTDLHSLQHFPLKFLLPFALHSTSLSPLHHPTYLSFFPPLPSSNSTFSLPLLSISFSISSISSSRFNSSLLPPHHNSPALLLPGFSLWMQQRMVSHLSLLLTSGSHGE